MILFTDYDAYYHQCTGMTRVSYCYIKIGNYLECFYFGCDFKFPSIFLLGSKPKGSYENELYLNLPGKEVKLHPLSALTAINVYGL